MFSFLVIFKKNNVIQEEGVANSFSQNVQIL